MQNDTPRIEPFHILLMDDDPVVLKGFEELLTDEGYRVTTASDGRQGLHLLRQCKPDLIITDILMPEMDGLEILLEIKKLKIDIPIIAISGGMKIRPVSFLPQAKSFGASRVFAKPVDLPELLTAIQELLQGSAESK